MRRIAIFVFSAALTSVFFINLCATIFRCGCRSLWNGADAHCNIHSAGAHHCPWCATGLVGSLLPWGVMIAAQAWISFRGKAWFAPAAFPVIGAILAAIYGLASGYWK